MFGCSVIRLGDRLLPNIGFTLQGDLKVFTRSAITLTKVNRFGWNLVHSEQIVGGWPWQMLGAIRAVASVREAGENFVFLSTTYRTISLISCWPNFTTFKHNNVDSVATKTFGTKFWTF